MFYLSKLHLILILLLPRVKKEWKKWSGRHLKKIKLPDKFKDYEIHLPAKLHYANIVEQNRITTRMLEDKRSYSTEYKASLCNVFKVVEPRNYKEASKEEGWTEAMNKELEALEVNEIWKLTQLPAGKKALDCKWVFKTKCKPDGNIEILKARLVARGDIQVEGKDYKHTFSPVAKFATVRCVIALATMKHWNLHQLDINNAFSHDFLEEEVYMKPPPRYTQGKPGEVCKLRKSLYGLNQASRQWNLELSEFLKAHGFSQSRRDYSPFSRVVNAKWTIVLVYVDDLLVSGDDEPYMVKLKANLDQQFTIKD